MDIDTILLVVALSMIILAYLNMVYDSMRRQNMEDISYFFLAFNVISIVIRYPYYIKNSMRIYVILDAVLTGILILLIVMKRIYSVRDLKTTTKSEH